MSFEKEADFEEAIIKMLTDSCGWESTVLKYKTEKELIQNWANILHSLCNPCNLKLRRYAKYIL